MQKLILLFILFSGTSLAQNNELLVNFTGQQIGNYIHLSLTVKSGITCTGTEVQRSTDSIHFETIGIIPGVCGSSVSDETYTFDDLLPEKNQNNFYRISFGQLGTSQIINVQYIDYRDGFAISPNPSSDFLNFYFSNFNSQQFIFQFYSLNGALLQTIETIGNTVVLDRKLLPSGMYILKVRDNNEILFTSGIILQ